MANVAHANVEIGPEASLHVVRGEVRGGVTFVLLPGYADSWWSYSLVLPRLAAEFDVVVIDPRGHGDSGRPACCYRVEDFAGDIVAVLDALELPRVPLVGHSGSCFAARQVAVRHPDRVAALGLIASPVALDRGPLQPLIDSVRSLKDPVPEDFIRDFQVGAAHLPLPGPFVEGLVSESAKVPARVWRDTLDGLVEYRDEHDLGSIAAPTTLIWGDRDPIVSREDQDRLRGAIRGAELVVLADTGHTPHWERPEATVDVLIELATRIG
jgi:pimeloyl-ACP methyl ester carboxylesterase